MAGPFDRKRQGRSRRVATDETTGQSLLRPFALSPEEMDLGVDPLSAPVFFPPSPLLQPETPTPSFMGRFLTNMVPFSPPGTPVDAAGQTMLPNQHGRLIPHSEADLQAMQAAPAPGQGRQASANPFNVASDDQIASLGPVPPTAIGNGLGSTSNTQQIALGRVPSRIGGSVPVDPYRPLSSFEGPPIDIPPRIPAPIQTAVEMEQSAVGSTPAIANLITASFANTPQLAAQGLRAYGDTVQRTTDQQTAQRRTYDAQRRVEIARQQHEQNLALGQFREAEATRRAQTKARVDMARANGQFLLQARGQLLSAQKMQMQRPQDALKAQRLQHDINKAQQDYYFKALPTIQSYSGMRHDYRALEEAKNEAARRGWFAEQSGVRGYMNWIGRGLKSGTWDLVFSDVSEADEFKAYINRVTRSVMPQAFSTLEGQGQVTDSERALMLENYAMSWDRNTGKVSIANAHAMASVLGGLYDQLENELKTNRSICRGSMIRVSTKF